LRWLSKQIRQPDVSFTTRMGDGRVLATGVEEVVDHRDYVDRTALRRTHEAAALALRRRPRRRWGPGRVWRAGRRVTGGGWRRLGCMAAYPNSAGHRAEQDRCGASETA
jgi:hypothetical protein